MGDMSQRIKFSISYGRPHTYDKWPLRVWQRKGQVNKCSSKT